MWPNLRPETGEMTRRPLCALLTTAGAVVLLGILIIWAVSGPGAVGSESAGAVRDGIREIPIRVHTWGFSPKLVHVNPEETVRFVVRTEDIAHGFAVNQLGINLQLVSGREVRSPAVRVDLPAGRYTIQCSVFCGMGHPSMKATLIVGKAGPGPGAGLPWVASVLSLAAAAAFVGFAGRGRRPGA